MCTTCVTVCIVSERLVGKHVIKKTTENIEINIYGTQYLRGKFYLHPEKYDRYVLDVRDAHNTRIKIEIRGRDTFIFKQTETSGVCSRRTNAVTSF